MTAAAPAVQSTAPYPWLDDAQEEQERLQRAGYYTRKEYVDFRGWRVLYWKPESEGKK